MSLNLVTDEARESIKRVWEEGYKEGRQVEITKQNRRVTFFGIMCSIGFLKLLYDLSWFVKIVICGN